MRERSRERADPWVPIKQRERERASLGECKFDNCAVRSHFVSTHTHTHIRMYTL